MTSARSVTLSMVFLILAGVGTYTLKHRVIYLESQLNRVKRDTAKLKESMHVLTAEWAYLNRPERLQQLAQEKLGLSHITHDQFITLEQLSETASAETLVHLTGGTHESGL